MNSPNDQPNILKLTEVEGKPVTLDASLPGQLPEAMASDTAAQKASLVISHLGNVFGGLHFGIEAELNGHPTEPEKREPLALAAEQRVKGVIDAALAEVGDEVEGETEAIVVNKIGLIVGRALAEDFLTRVDPLLNPDEDGEDRGESDVPMGGGNGDPPDISPGSDY
ncbi:MAG: hypothetical protein IT435_02580 [Phycisphaerales bacterium]|nr:hypothetical protein [Phycisphaerales bacterium]